MLKASGRILMIFSTKALIYTAIMAFVGLLVYLPFSLIVNTLAAKLIFMGVFGVIGFIIGTLKIPRIESIEFTKKTAGENIDEIIKRAIQFKLKKNKIYVYAKEEEDNVNK